jgi:hypothetical protein
VCGVFSGVVFGAVPGVGWRVDSVAAPSVFEGSGVFEVEVADAGSVASSESVPTVIRDVVPAGLVVGGVSVEGVGASCSTVGQLVECVFSESVVPDGVVHLRVEVGVVVPGVPLRLENRVSVFGGGAGEVVALSVNRLGLVCLCLARRISGFLLMG